MISLIDIHAQIETLQKQAAEIKAKEFANTVQDICDKMQAFGITLKDLQSVMGKSGSRAGSMRRRGGAAATSKRSSVAAKYRGPNGETWSGRGLSPRWLADLLAKGRTKEDFAIKD
jgi:DNA-binding protein H-NS